MAAKMPAAAELTARITPDVVVIFDNQADMLAFHQAPRLLSLRSV
ncbi:hypothetical protein [Arthrobacter sp. D5-1]|nr:hypothetical protein [Arthrobacter sp. D5-1]